MDRSKDRMVGYEKTARNVFSNCNFLITRSNEALDNTVVIKPAFGCVGYTYK